MRIITRNLLTRSYKLLLTLLVLLMSTNAFAQRLTATGKVVDAAGLEVIGASVLEKGTTNGVVTNLDGEFSLSVGQNATLVISFIGYKTIEVKATTNMNITLQEDNELLDEVVVIGYGSVKRKDVTTAVSTVSTKDLDQRPIVSAAQALQGNCLLYTSLTYFLSYRSRMVDIYFQLLTLLFSHHVCLIQVTTAPGFHLFPFRTEKLSPVTPMVLRLSLIHI